MATENFQRTSLQKWIPHPQKQLVIAASNCHNIASKLSNRYLLTSGPEAWARYLATWQVRPSWVMPNSHLPGNGVLHNSNFDIWRPKWRWLDWDWSKYTPVPKYRYLRYAIYDCCTSVSKFQMPVCFVGWTTIFDLMDILRQVHRFDPYITLNTTKSIVYHCHRVPNFS